MKQIQWTFELAEQQRIEIFLSKHDGEQALTHLEFLNQHELSPWLNNVKEAYEQRLISLWGQFLRSFRGYIYILRATVT